MRIDAAFRAGDLAALRAAVDDPDIVPNGPMPLAIGPCLEYAIYHSPLPFIRTLLEIGAEPNPSDHAGFPPLIAALSCSRPRPGSPGRTDVADILALLLSFGADPNQRGINDYTALHMAVAEGNLPGVRILLEAGADPELRTRIDDCETAGEMAAQAGAVRIVELLALERSLAAGKDINKLDKHGQTALMVAAHKGHEELVQFLIGRGAALDHTAKYRLSALMLAVIAGHTRIVEKLVRAGANTSLRGSGAPGFKDKTALDLAVEQGRADMADLIRGSS